MSHLVPIIFHIQNTYVPTLFTLYISDMPHPPNTQLALHADDTAILTQSWRTDTIARRLTHAMTM
jgi:hypothetical protein